MKKAYSYIRFSTPEQKKGDSARRQQAHIERSKIWCKENGFVLDDQLKDEGLSAYKGIHKTKGALGGFLDKVRTGEIEEGSALIVEAMDRLSREQITTAIPQFFEIINAGIVLVINERVYTQSDMNQNPYEIYGSISQIILANQESEQKSKRLKATWENKRNNIDKKILTGRCPAWLKPKKDRSGFEEIEDRSVIIKKIFDMYLNGKGVGVIIKELNEMPDIWKPQGTRMVTPSWRKGYVAKILKSPLVIGEIQPHKMVDGKKEPVGDPIKDYYPAVVSKDVFYAVQEKFKKNKGKFRGGRTGKISNLFTHLATCGYCGGAMHFINKGKPPKGNTYLVCDNAKRKNGCKYVSWKYDEFEKDIINLLSIGDLDLDSLMPSRTKIKSEIESLEIKKAGIDGRLSKLEFQIRNLTEAVSDAPNKTKRRMLSMSMDDKVEELEQLEQEKPAINKRISDLKSLNGNVEKRLNDTKKAFAQMEKADEKTRIDIRFKLRQMLKNLIDDIKVYPNGSENQGRKFRAYEIYFKGATRKLTRTYYPPEHYEKIKADEDKRKADWLKQTGGILQLKELIED